MKKFLLIILVGIFLLGCQAKKETTEVRYPDPPNMPPRIPWGPAIVVGDNIMPHPDKEKEDNPKERKEDGSNKKPSRGSPDNQQDRGSRARR